MGCGVILFGLNCWAWALFALVGAAVQLPIDMRARSYFESSFNTLFFIGFYSLAHTMIFDETKWPVAVIFMGTFFLMRGVGQMFFERDKPIGLGIPLCIWANIMMAPAVVALYRRSAALREASEAAKQDKARYDAAWALIKEGQEASLRKLASAVDRHRNRKTEQPTKDLQVLYSSRSHQRLVPRGSRVLGAALQGGALPGPAEDTSANAGKDIPFLCRASPTNPRPGSLIDCSRNSG